VWTPGEVGASSVSVVLQPAANDSVVPPSTVHIGIAPASGRLAEVLHEAHPAQVRHGARYSAGVVFDRAERWNVRVVVAGPAGGGERSIIVDVKRSAMFGPAGLILSSLPFLLVIGVYWRSAVVRRRRTATLRRPPPPSTAP